MMVIEAGGEESGFVSLERGTGAMVDCYLNDVPSAEGTLARVFFDIPLD